MLKALLAVVVTVLVTQGAVIATSVYLHRGLAHRALTLHPIADFFFRIILWITTGQDRRQWVAVHRKHHAFTDTDKASSWWPSIWCCTSSSSPRPSTASATGGGGGTS